MGSRDPYVLTNLAKAQHARGDRERAFATLWHALELDPNQDAGFGWYVGIQQERGGVAAYIEACRRLATLPRSWRAQLWLARDALAKGNVDAAVALYRDSLSGAGQPVPAELLMQMGGDLGKAGRLTQVVELVAPMFVAAQHGLEVGNNLIKANLDLGRFDDAKVVIDQLYEVKRPDWRSHLEFWDREVAKVRVAGKSQQGPEPSRLDVAMVSIEGPLWLWDRSPCASLVSPKLADAPRVAFVGSTALMPPERTGERVQLSDAPGRLSRALPLVMAEQVHLATSAAAHVLIPWVNGAGFALLGEPYGDAELCKLARTDTAPSTLVVSAILDVRGADWGASFRVLRGEDGSCIATGEARADPNSPAPAVEQLTSQLMSVLGETGISVNEPPRWYARPRGAQGTNYLLRLEQQLAVTCSVLQSLEGKQLSGEHEIVEGAIDLSLQQPKNVTTRLLLAHTLRQMKKARPELLALYRERVERLQREHPLDGDAGLCISTVLADAFASASTASR